MSTIGYNSYHNDIDHMMKQLENVEQSHNEKPPLFFDFFWLPRAGNMPLLDLRYSSALFYMAVKVAWGKVDILQFSTDTLILRGAHSNSELPFWWELLQPG